MRPPVSVQFLNHASVKISTDTLTVVSDPWYSGSIFNNGWDLICTSEELFRVASNTDFIWISHEHPDHFSPSFFKKLGGKKPQVLFQATRDRRVARYFLEQGFNVREIKNHDRVQLSAGETLMVGRNGLYDSWNLFESGGTRILNLNDCIIKTDRDVMAVKKRVGRVDVLLTQFSYAGWVGDKSHESLHKRAAQRRLDVVRRQVQCLEPAFVIPFASFAWYSHEENAYLNRSVNRIPAVLDVCTRTASTPIVMQPMGTWRVGEAHDNGPAVAFWERAFDGIGSRPLRRSPSVAMSVLRSECTAYQRRVFAKNSRLWMKMLSAVPLLKLFRPIHIRLTDIGRTVRFSFFDELRETNGTMPTDIEMSSDSLAFIFANEFGFDTLMVNARCSASKMGLDLVMKNFAVGSLNSMGWSIGPSLAAMVIREMGLVWLVLRELGNVNPE